MWGLDETLWRDMFGLLAICAEARVTALAERLRSEA